MENCIGCALQKIYTAASKTFIFFFTLNSFKSNHVFLVASKNVQLKHFESMSKMRLFRADKCFQFQVQFISTFELPGAA